MQSFEIWTEGYAAIGESGTATYHGDSISEDFIQACKIKLGSSDSFRVEKIMVKWNRGNPVYELQASLWGCRCFDNEDDARKSFG